MAEYLHPGVFVEEKSSGVRPIEGVGTSTAAFIGVTAKGVPNKATFITNATKRTTKFLSLAYQDTKIRVVGPNAIVRFNWVSESENLADGKKSGNKLHILMNWQKQGADWKLLSRAATKLA